METNTIASIQAFVPQLVRRWVADKPDTEHASVRGTVVVASLMRGAPTALLDDLLAVVAVRGGTTLKATGERTVVLFTGSNHETRAESTSTDLAASFHAQIGIESGDVDLFLVGCSHRELFVSGSVIDRAIKRDRTAQPGEVPSQAARSVLIAGRTGDVPTHRSWPDDLLPGTFVPEVVRRKLESGSAELEARDLPLALIHLANLDALASESGVETATRHLNDLVSRIQHAFITYDIAFVGSDVGPGGPAILSAAGVMRTASDDDERLLRALGEITDYPSPIEMRIGVDRGDVTCGPIGSRLRRTFVVFGEAVRSALELMSYAGPNEILVTADVARRTELDPNEPTHFGSRFVHRITKSVPHSRGVANMLLNLGDLAFEHEDFSGAKHYFEDALTLSRTAGVRPDEAELLTHLGHVALAMRDPELAMARCDEALAVRRDLGDEIGIAEAMTLLGRARYADGDPASARACWRFALEMLRTSTEPAAPPSA